jgi:hypothetical protein
MIVLIINYNIFFILISSLMTSFTLIVLKIIFSIFNSPMTEIDCSNIFCLDFLGKLL